MATMPHGKSGNMFEYLRSIYKGEKVFLTGHTGFKGSWLLKLLSMLGAEVKGYSLAPKSENDLFYLINGNNLCNSIINDLRNRDKLISEIADFKPRFLFHLAAQPLVRLSYITPSETFEVNAIGTANVLDGVRNIDGICHSIMITTDKVYHNYEWNYPYREIDRLGGYDPYSASKACAELVIDSYRNSFFNFNNYDIHRKAIAVARAGNVIGGGDWSDDRLMPDIIRALIKNEDVIIRNPNSIRPWQHVLEPVVGYLLLGAKLSDNPLKFASAYNFGPNLSDALPVKEMVNRAINTWGSGNFKIDQDANQPHEAGLLKLDISKAIAELNWRPKMDAAQAVSLTLKWYKNYINDAKGIDNFTETQIMEYLNA